MSQCNQNANSEHIHVQTSLSVHISNSRLTVRVLHMQTFRYNSIHNSEHSAPHHHRIAKTELQDYFRALLSSKGAAYSGVSGHLKVRFEAEEVVCSHFVFLGLLGFPLLIIIPCLLGSPRPRRSFKSSFIRSSLIITMRSQNLRFSLLIILCETSVKDKDVTTYFALAS